MNLVILLLLFDNIIYIINVKNIVLFLYIKIKLADINPPFSQFSMFRLLVINIYSTHFLPYFEAIDRDKAFRSHTQEQTSFQLQISFSGDTLPSSLGGFSYSTGYFLFSGDSLLIFPAKSPFTPVFASFCVFSIFIQVKKYFHFLEFFKLSINGNIRCKKR